MTSSKRFYHWNVWYDELPPDWRFQFVLWPMILVGAINILLTFSIRFPFGLLLLLGILFVAWIRIPYALGRGRAVVDGDVSQEMTDQPVIQISGVDWLIDWNRRYDQTPEFRRFWVFPAILVVAGAINMLLTIGSGFPFGLLFLLALLAVVVLRAPYTAGWLKPTDVVTAAGVDMSYDAEIDHTRQAAITTDPLAAEPVVTKPEMSPPTEMPPSAARVTDENDNPSIPRTPVEDPGRPGV